MIITPSKVFLDTQIIIDAERERIPRSDWASVSAYLKQATRYCISPLTIGELLSALVNGAGEYFELHKRRLSLLLSPNEQAEVFDFTPYFVAQQLGVYAKRPEHLETDFIGSIKLILAAPSKEALLDGFPIPGAEEETTARVRIDRFALEHAESKKKYVEFMSVRRERKVVQIPPEVWASRLLDYYEMSGAAVTPAIIAERLSASYEFEVSLNTLMKSEKFSVSKNSSDIVDVQQLCYLCDPSVVFITNDSDFRNRTKNSSQTSRIKTFAELLVCAHDKSSL